MSRQPHTVLADQADRERFCTELERNFSVIAPAGVGKTTSIVARVAALAQADAHLADPVLPRLAVVTYTHKAAREIQDRARAKLLADGAGPEQLGRFSQAFFGTIHSLCLMVLKNFGHLIGLPSNLSQVDDIDTLWRRYLRATDTVLQHLPTQAREHFLRHGSLTDALTLAPQLPTTLPHSPPLPPLPVPDISAILDTPAHKRADTQANIEKAKQLASRWLEAFHNGKGHLPLPVCTKGGAAFIETFNAAFAPLCDWLGEATLCLARGVAEDFRQFRKEQGLLTFDDMIAWAARVLEHPEAGELIRRRRWCIILDEAQDTDPLQFRILLGMTASATADNDDSDTAAAPQTTPAPALPLPAFGRFCMVGDPQQSIYGGRADLATYRDIHRQLVQSGQGEALRFTVTMRCDHAIVDAANATFPTLLRNLEASGDNADLALAQVEYVPLQARPAAGKGKVSRLRLEASDFTEDFSDFDDTDAEDAAADDEKNAKGKTDSKAKDRAAARALAKCLAENGPEAFGASDWSEIAILCPRNEPLSGIARAMEAQGLPVQNHSRTDLRADSPAYAWLTALARIFSAPEDAFEVAGVLREMFALADGALYDYIQAAGYGGVHTREQSASTMMAVAWHPLSLSAPPLANGGAVGEALELLRSVRNRALALPLREGAGLMSRLLKLPARLASLGDGRAAAWHDELENLLLQTAAYEEQGFDWQQWAHALYLGFTSKVESPEPLRGHIQLLSCHKSKGLQWPVVILANLFRPVKYGRANFPRLLIPSRNQPPRVAFASIHGHSSAEAALKLKDWHELQRLAYVACTRARRRMVWVDDSSFYEKPQGSFADALSLCEGGDNHAVWQQIPLWQPEPTGESDASAIATADTAQAVDAAGTITTAHSAQAAAMLASAPDALPRQTELFTATGASVFLENAKAPRPAWNEPFAATLGSTAAAQEQQLAQQAATLLRVLPSSLARHEPSPTALLSQTPATSIPAADSNHRSGHSRDEPDNRHTLPGFVELEAAAAAASGAEYGNWWHSAMERAPWGSDSAKWQQYGEAELTKCPTPERGADEWQQFLASALFTKLNLPQMVVRCELPLLWPDAEQSLAYDGFIDLVARDTASGQWLLVDWKTDRLGHFADPQAELLRCYGPQLGAYRRALESMFSATVQAHLYNTPSGACVPALATA